MTGFFGGASDDERIFLVLAAADHLKQKNTDLVRDLTAKGFTVLVITTNQPSAILRRSYEQNGIDPTRVFFIDAITKYALGSVPEGIERTTFISNPANLTDMGIALTGMLRDLQGEETCILFDSISTMLIYLPSVNISKFIHFVTNKLRLLDVAGIFLAVEEGLDPVMLSQLTTFADRVIR
ncbi:hypothetical protein FGU65_08465 [Methanoculleus sp. FWC-SCC1]|uniref:KaiC-like domain-containing protein n=1 Tax=Methanoculleus frigidifontis TaxID=2584085 RepID=A0ABT8MAG0_9EURY|nr:hypothetical protein [Methanoculleus sp. FWC-SCC1]MDN7024919.1 hypothetical protein [Methanoculleus sp. FWC-SCC1]